jgi:hypothetical protein
MKRLLFIICTIGCFGCSDKGDALCTKKYESKKFGVTIYHSDNWNPYEFYGRNIGLEYQGLENFERRYDAEIVITFFSAGISEEDFYNIYANNDIKQAIVEKLGGSVESKTFDKGTTDFANKKWKTLETAENGSFKDESFTSTETNYLWHSSSGSIAIRVRVKGKGDIKGLDDEVECILSRLEFQERTAYNKTNVRLPV